MDKLLYHHLGMGDHIVHNGMIRYLYSFTKNENFFIFSKKINLRNVEFMFRDLNRLKVIPVENDSEAINIYNNFNGDRINNILDSNEHKLYSLIADDVFYKKMNLLPTIKKEFFHFQRDYELENNCYNELILDKNITDYIFLHEDIERGYLIDRNKIESKLPIVKADRKYGIFELLKVIENAKEVHLISSSFLSLLTCNKYNNNITAHMYIRCSDISDYVKKNDIKVI